jgi:hypothetical protein
MVLVAWARSKEFGPFSALLFALVAFIACVPFAQEGLLPDRTLFFGFYIVMVAGLGVAREHIAYLGIALLLIASRVFAEQFPQLITDDESLHPVPGAILATAYCGYLIVIVLRTLSKQDETTVDIILGGINVYLLLALLFMLVHFVLEVLQPGSYTQGGVALSELSRPGGGDLKTTLFYFSFTTLTTLGYGDIVPSRPIAQFVSIAEAVIGQLYIAIFIGGLVALRISGLRRA